LSQDYTTKALLFGKDFQAFPVMRIPVAPPTCLNEEMIKLDFDLKFEVVPEESVEGNIQTVI
jgi:hypothetical protein